MYRVSTFWAQQRAIDILYNWGAMSEEKEGKSRGERRDEKRRKRRYGPRLHGKRLAELVRNALRKRLGRKG